MTYDKKALEAAAKAIGKVAICEQCVIAAFAGEPCEECADKAKAALTAYHSHEIVQREEAGMVEVPVGALRRVIAVPCHPCADECGDDCGDLAILQRICKAAQGGKGGGG